MHLKRGSWIGLGLAVLAAVAGVLLAAQLSSPARASTTYTWTPYNLSALAGGVQSAGPPALVTDPVSGALSAVTSSPNDDTMVFSGDGSGAVSATNVTNAASGGLPGQAAPAAITDAQNKDYLVLTYASGGEPISYDRNPTTLAWTTYNLGEGCCTANGGDLPDIADNPAMAEMAATNTLAVAADSPNDDLEFFSRDDTGGWSATNVSTATGQTIDSIPDLVSDPSNGTPTVLAVGANGHLLNFDDPGGSWQVLDVTAQFGGQTITNNPTALVDAGLLYLFSEAPGGDLIEWSRSSSGGWSSQNLTSLANGPTVVGLPSAVVDPNGGIDVFDQGSDEHLVEYSGSGSSWSASDLTADDGASTIESTPTAAIDPQNGNLVVDATSPAGDLIEMERTAASAATTSTPTVTVVSTPVAPTKTSAKAVNVRLLINLTWTRRASEIHWIRLGKLSRGEGFAIACRGTGHRHTAGCPYRFRSARTPRSIATLLRRSANTVYRVGDVLTLTVSEPGRRSQVTRLTIRARRAPLERTTR